MAFNQMTNHAAKIKCNPCGTNDSDSLGPVNLLLSRLDLVRSVGRNRWMARCPVHADKNPSLSIGLKDRILVHCFGCGANGQDVTSSLGMDISALFPSRSPVERARINIAVKRRKLLSELSFHKLVWSIWTGATERDEPINGDDIRAAMRAKKRLIELTEVLRHG